MADGGAKEASKGEKVHGKGNKGNKSRGIKKGGHFKKEKTPRNREAQKNKNFFELRKGKDKPQGGSEDKFSDVRCLCCREKGHLAKHCPKNDEAKKASQCKFVPKGDATRKGRCYNCGEEGHSIHSCPKPKKSGGKLEFATCFVCKQQGHISSQCPQNERGIYPRGGCCKICESVRHLAKDCPEKGTAKDKKAQAAGAGTRKDKGADDLSGNAVFELHLKGQGAPEAEQNLQDAEDKPPKKKKIVKF